MRPDRTWFAVCLANAGRHRPGAWSEAPLFHSLYCTVAALTGFHSMLAARCEGQAQHGARYASTQISAANSRDVHIGSTKMNAMDPGA